MNATRTLLFDCSFFGVYVTSTCLPQAVAIARCAAFLALKVIGVPGAGHCVVLGDAILMGRHGIAMRVLMGVEKQTKNHFSRVFVREIVLSFEQHTRRDPASRFLGLLVNFPDEGVRKGGLNFQTLSPRGDSYFQKITASGVCVYQTF